MNFGIDEKVSDVERKVLISTSTTSHTDEVKAFFGSSKRIDCLLINVANTTDLYFSTITSPMQRSTVKKIDKENIKRSEAVVRVQPVGATQT